MKFLSVVIVIAATLVATSIAMPAPVPVEGPTEDTCIPEGPCGICSGSLLAC